MFSIRCSHTVKASCVSLHLIENCLSSQSSRLMDRLCPTRLHLTSRLHPRKRCALSSTTSLTTAFKRFKRSFLMKSATCQSKFLWRQLLRRPERGVYAGVGMSDPFDRFSPQACIRKEKEAALDKTSRALRGNPIQIVGLWVWTREGGTWFSHSAAGVSGRGE